MSATPPDSAAREWLFYDGCCGLCHRAVRFVLARGAAGETFRFAPLGGERFQELVPEDQRAALPDSLVVRTADGRLLTRSAGLLYIAARLGGVWRVAAAVFRLIPRALRDAVYDAVAAVRHRLFARPAGSCPAVPPHLQPRFDR